MRKLLTLAILGTGIAGFAAAASAECSLGHKASLTTAQDATPVPETKPAPQQTATADTAADDTTLQTAQAPQATATE